MYIWGVTWCCRRLKGRGWLTMYVWTTRNDVGKNGAKSYTKHFFFLLILMPLTLLTLTTQQYQCIILNYRIIIVVCGKILIVWHFTYTCTSISTYHQIIIIWCSLFTQGRCWDQKRPRDVSVTRRLNRKCWRRTKLCMWLIWWRSFGNVMM